MAKTRVVALVDMDCFYVQVEEREKPQLKGIPAAVVQYNAWRGGGIIAVNYEARGFGVKRGMRGDQAREKCPDIQLVQVPVSRGKADLTKYRDAGKEVINVLAEFSDCIERASIDEAYVDLTGVVERRLAASEVTAEALTSTWVVGQDCEDGGSDERETGLKKWLAKLYKKKKKREEDDDEEEEEDEEEASEEDRRLAVGAVLCEEMRRAVFTKTTFKCSAGIAHNKMLAKLSCGLHKPNQQTVLPQGEVPTLWDNMPVGKVRNLGGKLGDSLTERLGCVTMGDLARVPQGRLAALYDPKTAHWLYNLGRGIDTEPVTARQLAKSIGCGKNFQGREALDTQEKVRKWTLSLSEELSERLEADKGANTRMATTLTVGVRLDGDDRFSITRSCRLPSYDAGTIARLALAQFQHTNTAATVSETVWSPAIKNISLSAGKFDDIGERRRTSANIQDMFRKVAKRNASTSNSAQTSTLSNTTKKLSSIGSVAKDPNSSSLWPSNPTQVDKDTNSSSLWLSNSSQVDKNPNSPSVAVSCSTSFSPSRVTKNPKKSILSTSQRAKPSPPSKISSRIDSSLQPSIFASPSSAKSPSTSFFPSKRSSSSSLTNRREENERLFNASDIMDQSELQEERTSQSEPQEERTSQSEPQEERMSQSESQEERTSQLEPQEERTSQLESSYCQLTNGNAEVGKDQGVGILKVSQGRFSFPSQARTRSPEGQRERKGRSFFRNFLANKMMSENGVTEGVNGVEVVLRTSGDDCGGVGDENSDDEARGTKILDKGTQRVEHEEGKVEIDENGEENHRKMEGKGTKILDTGTQWKEDKERKLEKDEIEEENRRKIEGKGMKVQDKGTEEKLEKDENEEENKRKMEAKGMKILENRTQRELDIKGKLEDEETEEENERKTGDKRMKTPDRGAQSKLRIEINSEKDEIDEENENNRSLSPELFSSWEVEKQEERMRERAERKRRRDKRRMEIRDRGEPSHGRQRDKVEDRTNASQFDVANIDVSILPFLPLDMRREIEEQLGRVEREEGRVEREGGKGRAEGEREKPATLTNRKSEATKDPNSDNRNLGIMKYIQRSPRKALPDPPSASTGDLTRCEECHEWVSAFELPEHLDYHMALKLQKEWRSGPSWHSPAPPSARRGSRKRGRPPKTPPEKPPGGKIQKLESFFTR